MGQPNQFTKADAEGRARPRAMNAYVKGTRDRMDPRQKAQIRAEQLMRRLHKFALGKKHRGKQINMDQAQVTAAKVLIDKGAPSLQAIEQTNLDPLEAMSSEEQIDMARALILAHPEIIQALNLQVVPSLVPATSVTELVPTITKVIDSTGA